MSKLAVIFPGMGYTAAKPILYYAKRLAEQAGYEIAEIDYGSIAPDAIRTPEGRDAAYRQALEHAEETLSGLHLPERDDVLFLSKSLGTGAAGAYQLHHDLRARNIWFTPVRTMIPLLKLGGLAFMGGNDPWADAGEVSAAAAEFPVELHVLPCANHSLETGDALRDMNSLCEVMQRVKEYILAV